MSIDFSIWGIRRGFEPAGMLHSHTYPEVMVLQKDRFRSLSNAIGGKGFYLINRLGTRLVITYVHTGIREYVPNGSPRPGYVAFSLIIPGNLAFDHSPRAVLQQMATFYEERVGETQNNNFSEAEIRGLLSSLRLAPARPGQNPEYAPAYAYYEQSLEVDELLTGNASYARFSELILIPGYRDAQTGRFQEVPFIDSSQPNPPRCIDLSQSRHSYQQERQRQEEQQRRNEEENKNREQWQAEARRLDPEIDKLIREGRLEDARALALSRPELRKYLSSMTKLEEQEREARSNEEARKAAERIQQLLHARNLEEAHAIWRQDPRIDNYLDSHARQAIRSFENEKREKERQEREREERRKKRAEMLRFGGLGIAAVVLVGLGIYAGMAIFNGIGAGEGEGSGPTKADTTKPDTIKTPRPIEVVLSPMQQDSADICEGKTITIKPGNADFNKNPSVKKKVMDEGFKFFKYDTIKKAYLFANNETSSNYKPVPKEVHEALNAYLHLNHTFPKPEAALPPEQITPPGGSGNQGEKTKVQGGESAKGGADKSKVDQKKTNGGNPKAKLTADEEKRLKELSETLNRNNTQEKEYRNLLKKK